MIPQKNLLKFYSPKPCAKFFVAPFSPQKLYLKIEDLWRKKFQTKNVRVILLKNDNLTNILIMHPKSAIER